MKTILLNANKLFTRNKGFYYQITILPILGFLMMSFLLPYSTEHNVAFIGTETEQNIQVEEALESLEGISLMDIRSDEIDSKLRAGNIELAVIMSENGQVQLRKIGSSEVERAVSLCIQQALTEGTRNSIVNVNEAPRKGLSLANSLGFMVFKLITSGNVLAALIIAERTKRMKDRILLSGTKCSSYLGGISIVFLFYMMISSLVYYLAVLILNFDFGMQNSLGFLLIMFVTNVFCTALYLLMSTLFDKEEPLWFLASFILMPMSLFSGLMFPYEFMPTFMQKIGSLFPHRWIAHAIESIQTNGTIFSALPDITLILGISAIMFIIAVKRSTLKVQTTPAK